MIWSLTRAMISSTSLPPYGLWGSAGRFCAMAAAARRTVPATDNEETESKRRFIGRRRKAGNKGPGNRGGRVACFIDVIVTAVEAGTQRHGPGIWELGMSP